MVEKGLADHGWSYINIDDGWQGRRGGRYNAIQPNKKFPDMAALTREIHDMGLRVGIYSTPWIGTYAAHIGSYSDRPDGENEWIEKGLHNENYRYQKPVSYTHLDVYKRQPLRIARRQRRDDHHHQERPRFGEDDHQRAGRVGRIGPDAHP